MVKGVNGRTIPLLGENQVGPALIQMYHK